jgi:hypothetical protein
MDEMTAWYMPEKPPLPACQSNTTADHWLPHVFTLAFTLLAFCHCRWARDPLITSALAYNLIRLWAPLPGYGTPGENTVKWLQKLLYGLKQAGRCWYDTLACALTNLGFHITQADPGVFSARTSTHSLILTIHINNCILTRDSAKLIAE